MLFRSQVMIEFARKLAGDLHARVYLPGAIVFRAFRLVRHIRDAIECPTALKDIYRIQFLRQVEVGIRAASPRRMRRCAAGVR